MNLEPRSNLGRRKWALNEIIAADCQALLKRMFAVAGYKDDGSRLVTVDFAKLAADENAVDFRHFEVEHENVDVLCYREGQCLVAGLRMDNFEAFRLQHLLDRNPS